MNHDPYEVLTELHQYNRYNMMSMILNVEAKTFSSMRSRPPIVAYLDRAVRNGMPIGTLPAFEYFRDCLLERVLPEHGDSEELSYIRHFEVEIENAIHRLRRSRARLNV